VQRNEPHVDALGRRPNRETGCEDGHVVLREFVRDLFEGGAGDQSSGHEHPRDKDGRSERLIEGNPTERRYQGLGRESISVRGHLHKPIEESIPLVRKRCDEKRPVTHHPECSVEVLMLERTIGLLMCCFTILELEPLRNGISDADQRRGGERLGQHGLRVEQVSVTLQ